MEAGTILKNESLTITIPQKELILKALLNSPRIIRTRNFKSINDFDVYVGPDTLKDDIICMYKIYEERFNDVTKIPDVTFCNILSPLINKKRTTFLIIRQRRSMQDLQQVYLKQNENIFHVVDKKSKTDFTIDLTIENIVGEKRLYKYCVKNNRIYLPMLKSENPFISIFGEDASSVSNMRSYPEEYLTFHQYVVENLPANCEIIICFEGKEGSELVHLTREDFIDNRVEKMVGYKGIDSVCGITVNKLRTIERLYKVF